MSVLAVAIGVGGSGCGEQPEGLGQDDRPIEGQLQVVMVGDGTSAHPEYFLSTVARGDRWLRLLFDAHPELAGVHHDQDGVGEHAHLAGGTTVRVTGTSIDGDTLQVQALLAMQGPSVASGAVVATQSALIAPSPKKVAIILANFTNNTAQPITTDEARSRVFTATTSTNAYFKEQSFGIRSLIGKVRADGDVFGWYTIAPSATACDYSAWGTAARAAAQAAGVDLTGYDHIIHYFPRDSGCGWSGVGQMPGRYTWINGSTSSTMAHELGHNFGVHHSSSMSCTNTAGARITVGGTCTSSEYGDVFDVMGRGYRHMNAYQKSRLGFFEPANVVTAAASGSFLVAPIETKSTGVQSLRVNVPGTTTYYYVEFRQPIGIDAGSVSGVIVHRNADHTLSGQAQRTQLLDMTPATTSYNDSALAVGATFTDAAAAITIRVTAAASTGATVQVTR